MSPQDPVMVAFMKRWKDHTSREVKSSVIRPDATKADIAASKADAYNDQRKCDELKTDDPR